MAARGLTCPRVAPSAQASRRLNILSLSTEFPNPSEPGKGLFVCARLRAMSAAADVTVVAPVPLLDYANPRNELLASLRVPHERLDGASPILHPRWLYPPFGGFLNPLLLYARLRLPVARLCERRHIDLIDAHYGFPEGVAAALLSRAVGVPFMITLRGLELRRRHRRWMRRSMQWAIRRAARVVAVSDGLHQLAVDLGAPPDRVVTIPNGVDRDVFFRRDRARSREEHGIRPDESVVLCAGDLAELKGHHKVIRALGSLSGVHRSLRLIIAGGVGRSGRYAQALREQVRRERLADRVCFRGEVKQHALAELMSAADVFCLASSSEGWPNVVHEALACGTPVVATDVGAVRQMIPSDTYGSIVPVNDVDALAEALGAALTRAWNHHAISCWGRSRTWTQVANEILQQAHAAVDGNRQGRP